MTIRGAAILLALALPARAQPRFQVCFTPGGDCEGMIVGAIDAARRTVHVQAYSFTNRLIAEALVRAERRGIAAVVLLDKTQRERRYSVARELVAAGIAVRFDDRPAIAHNKVGIVDGVIVETGSFNFTASAQRRNAENALIVRDDPPLAAAYERYFASRIAVSDPW